MTAGGFITRSGKLLEDLSPRASQLAVVPPPQTAGLGVPKRRLRTERPEWSAPRYHDVDAWRRSPSDTGPNRFALLRSVSVITGVSESDLRSAKRFAHIAKARHIAAYVLIKIAKTSLKRAGNILKCDHATAHYGAQRTCAVIKANCLQDETEIISLIEALWAADWPSKAQRGQP